MRQYCQRERERAAEEREREREEKDQQHKLKVRQYCQREREPRREGGREREDAVGVITVESVHMVVIGTVCVHISVCHKLVCVCVSIYS